MQLATVTGEIDLSTPTGRLVARTLGAAARHESEHKSERMRRASLQAGEQGRPHSSGQRGYGYAADHVTILEAEAEVIREAATRILAGEAQGSVAADLNARGIPTTTGKQWRVNTLHDVLASARISGRREYHGEIMADPSWPTVITAEQSDRLRALLARPDGQPRQRRAYLYSWLLAAVGTAAAGRCRAGCTTAATAGTCASRRQECPAAAGRRSTPSRLRWRPRPGADRAGLPGVLGPAAPRRHGHGQPG